MIVHSEKRDSNSRRVAIALWLAWFVGMGCVLAVEVPRIREASGQQHAFTIWLINRDPSAAQSLLALPVLLALPLFWFPRRSILERRRRAEPLIVIPVRPPTEAEKRVDRWAGWGAWSAALLIGVTSIIMSATLSTMRLSSSSDVRFGDLPPAYHDEFSYLFQAKTFQAGRLSFPSHATMPELFDEMHVLNVDGRFASRYFPGAGAWIAPFLAMHHPSWGHWLAGALSAMLIFWAGRELGGTGVGLIAGILTALSPGMALFSNLILAHHPTLVGLTLFTFTFLRMMRTRKWIYAFWAGCGLGFAMLCRPMTAAGFALPFGLWFFAWLAFGRFPVPDCRARRRGFLLGMSIPMALCFATLLFTNRAITGSAFKTPYEVYTEVYTPRHVYGFNNRVRGEEHLGPRVIENYDKWAENLTPRLAARNVKDRFLATWQWTLGTVPLAMGTVVFLILVPTGDRRWLLIPASIVSLHAVHVPYWFVGIMNWHYVFESGPLWLLLFAGATATLLGNWRRAERPLMPVWWFAIVAATMIPTFTSFEPFWPASRLEAAVDEVGFSRNRYALFHQLLEQEVKDRPALVLVIPDLADRSIDFVENEPTLDSDILVGRFRRDVTDVAEVQRAFPDRTLYIFEPQFNVERWRLTRVPQ